MNANIPTKRAGIHTKHSLVRALSWTDCIHSLEELNSFIEKNTDFSAKDCFFIWKTLPLMTSRKRQACMIFARSIWFGGLNIPELRWRILTTCHSQLNWSSAWRHQVLESIKAFSRKNTQTRVPGQDKLHLGGKYTPCVLVNHTRQSGPISNLKLYTQEVQTRKWGTRFYTHTFFFFLGKHALQRRSPNVAPHSGGPTPVWPYKGKGFTGVTTHTTTTRV